MENIQPILEKLATGLNVKVEFLWGVLVSGQLPYALGNLLTALLAFFLGGFVGKWIFHTVKKQEEFDWDGGMGTLVKIGSIFSGLTFLIGFLAICCSLTHVIVAIASPEFSALQSILDLIK